MSVRWVGWCALLLAGVLLMAGWGEKSREHVRAPAVAGTFYPGTPNQLAGTVDHLLDAAPATTLEGELVALLVPHAGYEYSGSVAATAFRHVRGRRIDTVILVGVAHRVPVEGAAVYPGTALATPLGQVRIDPDGVEWLTKRSSLITRAAAPHEGEHSLEVELPFLQRVLPNATIIPLVMGSPDLATCRLVGEALAEYVQRETQAGRTCLLIASSDLSHYPSLDVAQIVDGRSLVAVQSGDPVLVDRTSSDLMAQGYPQLFCTFCGEGALKTVMAAAQRLGAHRVTVLRQATSAEAVSHDERRVVGYAAVAFTQVAPAPSSADAPADAAEAPPWQGEEQRLLRLAREALRQQLTTGHPPSEMLDTNWPAALQEPAAVFVTLTRNGELRGCVGTTEPQFPLGLAVQRYAIAAAIQDTRFLPVRAHELDTLRLEISVLSPAWRISDPSDIRPGVHGVIVKRGNRMGLFLPQVWEDTGWNREEFLQQLCRQKAGLPPDAWRDPATELSIFTVHSFEEHP